MESQAAAAAALQHCVVSSPPPPPRKAARQGVLAYYIPVAASLLVAVLLKLDWMGPLAGLNFQPQLHPLAPLHEVAAKWPKDAAFSSLSRAKVSRGLMGPESLAFDPQGAGPYAGVADGRVVRWKDGEWHTFAVVAPSWERSCASELTPATEARGWNKEHKCGRPLGLRFHNDGRLFIADAYFGLYAVGPEGGQAVPVATQVDGDPFLFTNDLDLHPNGSIFFTDSSRRWRRHHHFMVFVEGDNTGRLLRHDPGPNRTQVVLSGLNFPNGVAIAQDASFLVLAETTNARLLRVWLEGPKSGTTEVFADLIGYPDNVRRNEGGQFWVAINGPRTWLQQMVSRNPWLKKLIFKLPFPTWLTLRLLRPPKMFITVALVDESGRVVMVLEERNGTVVKSVSQVQEQEGRLWLGSVAHHQIATLQI